MGTVGIKWTEELTKKYTDEDGNMQFLDQVLEEINEKQHYSANP